MTGPLGPYDLGDEPDLVERRAAAVFALTGCRVTFGNEIADYWKTGPGAARIRWGTPGDFTRCKRFLTSKVGPERAARFCAQWHHDVVGYWPGDKRNTG